ncbi:hypothetical protein [Buttiauxella izardii]|uniref:Uncharacterized protein n=1 Tax=Buttiauxella izardii TaxID=82991 RepID=A0A3A5JSX0_9ENTR|nr:hypothetical protein [Buttiauxella izardii]RJT24037.1 hypothetical protein D6029_07915 [Buttiauxella izardii]
MNYVFELLKAEQHIHQQDEHIAYLEALTRQQRASIQGINARLYKLEQRPVTVHNTVNTVNIVNAPRNVRKEALTFAESMEHFIDGKAERERRYQDRLKANHS